MSDEDYPIFSVVISFGYSPDHTGMITGKTAYDIIWGVVQDNTFWPGTVMNIAKDLGLVDVAMSSSNVVIHNLQVIGYTPAVGDKVFLDFTVYPPIVMSSALPPEVPPAEDAMSRADNRRAFLAAAGIEDLSWDGIRLYSYDGVFKGAYPTSGSGLDMAIAASANYDTFHIPPCTIEGNHYLYGLRYYVGASRETVIFTGQITSGSGAQLENFSIIRDEDWTSGSPLIGFEFQGLVRMKKCSVKVTRRDTNGLAIAVKAGVSGSSLRARECSFKSNQFGFWSRESGYFLGTEVMSRVVPAVTQYFDQDGIPRYSEEGFGPAGMVFVGSDSTTSGDTKPKLWFAHKLLLALDEFVNDVQYSNPCLAIWVRICPNFYPQGTGMFFWQWAAVEAPMAGISNYVVQGRERAIYNLYCYNTRNKTPEDEATFGEDRFWAFYDKTIPSFGGIGLSTLEWDLYGSSATLDFGMPFLGYPFNVTPGSEYPILFYPVRPDGFYASPDGNQITGWGNSVGFGLREPYRRSDILHLVISKISVYYDSYGVRAQKILWQGGNLSGYNPTDRQFTQPNNQYHYWSVNHFYNCTFGHGSNAGPGLDISAQFGTTCFVQDCTYDHNNSFGDVREAQGAYWGVEW